MLADHYDFRQKITDALERDLMGPSTPDEVIGDPPITRYVTGILFPQNSGTLDASQDMEQDDPGADDVEGGEWDPPISMSHVRYPSSLGMTFAVATETSTTIVIRVQAARYEPLERDDEPDGEGASASSADEAGPLGRRAHPKEQPEWRRVELDLPTVDLDVSKPCAELTTELEDGLCLFCRVRPVDDFGRASVTLILINTRISRSTFGRDEDSYFQPKLLVEAVHGAAAFVHRPGAELPASDEDVQSHQLLYRDAVSIATGHGTAVDWDQDKDDTRRASAVWTCVIPRYELNLADSNPDIPTDALQMMSFVRDPREKTLASLSALCDQYEAWITATDQRIPSLNGAIQETARRHVARCSDALARIREGINNLRSDSDAWEAFRIANRAMLMQRARSDWLASGDHDSPPTLDGDHRWRPFQIAFILLCLPGIVSPDSEDRELTDLLWFPTGGGKTEAYLGLLAFTTALRRLRDPAHGHGITVIMRYTLRLLTIQQFERAALLICCLESIRRDDPRLGSEPIEIGLWVGRGATPNSLAEAKVSLDKLRQGVRLEKSNPLQLHRCPWCATTIEPRNLWIAKAPARLVTACRTDGCDFATGLPICVVDEDIYRRHPTLVIATADKFASMPWRDECRALFNADVPSLPPPDLIIQDELHLISGPLGTLAGLYETAVDLLCSVQGRRPKVIASTATIRRADSQTAGLFDRDVRQFPPPGIDAGDSFFAREASPDEKGTRLYVGVTAPGTSQTTLLVRTYAALLQAAAELDGADDVKDPYWTLVGYFNSLRVLGGARMQVQDDVNDRLELLSALHARPKRDIPIDRRIELTSREPSGDIPDHLRRMNISLPDQAALDVILATNMISVGVDINRLGLMVVMGQPQSTSEYIQATSRVGRRYPGLVITMLNAAKSRDRSHYESFHDYHAALYRQVESSSVTPFSAQARSRGLHAVLVALARLTVPELRSNDGARRIGSVVDRLGPARAAILERVQRVDPDEASATAAQLDQIIADWVLRAEEEPDLVYANQHHPDKALLGDAGLAGEDFQSTFPTLWSLRDVDLSSNLYQVV
ncbi:MAG: helicase-related protein [Actinomycetota bacterium]